MEENLIKKSPLVKTTQTKRSNSYPSISVAKAVEVTEVIYKNAGNNFLPVEQIAKLLKKNPVYISQWLSSCVQYGLIELKFKVGYRPAFICKKIFKPFSDIEKNEALIECFKKPKLYQELISKYENHTIPSRSVLPNILDRDHNIYDDAAIKASDAFNDNISDLGLLNKDDELVFSNENQVKINTPEEIPEENSLIEFKETQNNKMQGETITVYKKFESEDILKSEIPLTEDKKATLFYPKNINISDIQILKAQIELLMLYINLNNYKNE